MNKKVSIISVAMMLLTLTSVTACDRGNQDISINNEKHNYMLEFMKAV